MTYAIIKLGGKQLKVTEGQTFEIERQADLSNEVLAYSDDKNVLLGDPILKNYKVELEKVEDKKDKKVEITRFRAKSRHKRKKGHRQPISVVKVKSISKEGK